MKGFYTVTEAAKRVRRSRRSIEDWIREGLTVTMVTTGARKIRYINETDLLRVYRSKLLNNPTRPTQPR